MFSKAGKRRGQTADHGMLAGTGSQSLRSVPSIVSADMTLIGDLRSNGDVHVDGTVQGDIAVRHLTVGEAATVRGEITADSVRVCGSVSGRISAREVILTATARMHGDVHHETLSIEAGAHLDGHCRRIGDQPSARDTPESITTKQIEGGRLKLEPVAGATH